MTISYFHCGVTWNNILEGREGRERWSFVRHTRSTCKAKRKNYLGLASRSWRRSWRSAGVIYSVIMALMGFLTTIHALTIAQVTWKKKKNEKENIFTCFCWYSSSLFGLFFLVLVVFPNLDWCLANLLDLNKGGDFFGGEFCMCYLLQNFNMKYCPLHFFFSVLRNNHPCNMYDSLVLLFDGPFLQGLLVSLFSQA